MDTHSHHLTEMKTSYMLSTQMVRLHRDPQGEHVFALPQGGTAVDNTDVETLRTRVRELEKMLKDQTTIVSITYKQLVLITT